ncbi:tetratricopeptide repeat protein [Pseudomonadota bacterium]
MESQDGWENAKVMAHLALDQRPEFTSARLIVAAALEQDQRYADANAIYAKIPITSPLSWSARMHLANNYDRMDNTKRAIRLFEKLARERADSANPLIALGDLLRRHERFKEAASAYTRALARVTDLRAAHWVLYYSRGIAYEQSKQWPKAEADFLKALDLSPDQPLTLNYLGYSWIDLGQHLERSLAMIKKAVELRPRDGYIVDSLGWGLYRTGDFKGAVKSLERAVMLLPADPVVNDHLGDALWRVGRTREARFQWERALKMEPTADLAKAIAAKLEGGLPAAKNAAKSAK